MVGSFLTLNWFMEAVMDYAKILRSTKNISSMDLGNYEKHY
jgi:hypothetical protein